MSLFYRNRPRSGSQSPPSPRRANRLLAHKENPATCAAHKTHKERRLLYPGNRVTPALRRRSNSPLSKIRYGALHSRSIHAKCAFTWTPCLGRSLAGSRGGDDENDPSQAAPPQGRKGKRAYSMPKYRGLARPDYGAHSFFEETVSLHRDADNTKTTMQTTNPSTPRTIRATGTPTPPDSTKKTQPVPSPKMTDRPIHYSTGSQENVQPVKPQRPDSKQLQTRANCGG